MFADISRTDGTEPVPFFFSVGNKEINSYRPGQSFFEKRKIINVPFHFAVNILGCDGRVESF